MPNAYQFIRDARTFLGIWHPTSKWTDDELLLVAQALDSWSSDLKQEHERRTGLRAAAQDHVEEEDG